MQKLIYTRFWSFFQSSCIYADICMYIKVTATSLFYIDKNTHTGMGSLSNLGFVTPKALRQGINSQSHRENISGVDEHKALHKA